MNKVIKSLFIGLLFFVSVRVFAAYPEKPIKLIVPFPPGGSTDIFARMLANQMSAQYKQPVVIENKPGASGQIAMDVLLNAPADGYMIYLGNIGSLAVNVPLFPHLNYDPRKDLAPVGLITIVPNVFVVNPKLGIKNLAELIGYAKAHPGKMTYGSGGNGSAAHTAMEFFKLQTGVDLTHIPYKGTIPAVTDVLGGQVDMIMTGVPPLLPFIHSGKLIPLGVSTKKRIEALPQVPAIAETDLASLKNFEATQWYGLVVKKGTPQEIVQKLNSSLHHTFDAAAAREQLKNEGAIVQTGTPEEFGSFIDSEINRWTKVVRAANIQAN
jgi:tripartite-type tricarboxylate transporter receptor subunit TctC